MDLKKATTMTINLGKVKASVVLYYPDRTVTKHFVKRYGRWVRKLVLSFVEEEDLDNQLCKTLEQYEA